MARSQSIVVTVPPARLAVSLADAKAHLRVSGENDNREILSIIKAATDWVERYTGRALITRTYQFGMQGWPDVIKLQNPPLISVDAITYLDQDGASQTLAADQYNVDALSEVGTIYPAFGVSWPSLRDQINNVIVEYQAGYGDDASAVPGDIASAIKLLIGQLYEHREEDVVGIGASVIKINFGVESLLARYRMLAI